MTIRSLRSLHWLSSSVLMRTVRSFPFWTNTTGKVVWWCPELNSDKNSLLSRVRDGMSRSFKKRFHSFFIPTGLWVNVLSVWVLVPETAAVPEEKFLNGCNTPLLILSTIRRVFVPGIYDPSRCFIYNNLGLRQSEATHTSVILHHVYCPQK